MNITEILPNFKTLKEYREFLEQLVEKSADGEEIARGMDKHDKSKNQKENPVKKEVEKKADGSAVETHYDTDSVPDIPPQEPNPVPLQPGQQVNIGRKVIDQGQTEPKTVEIKMTGETDKINLKPKLDTNKFGIK